MPQFAANLSLLFPEHPFIERFEAAARAGFCAVEVQFPYAFPVDQIGEQLLRHGLRLVMHNLPAGNWQAGDRGLAADPRRRGEFQDGVGRAIDYARALGCPRLNCLAGLLPADLPVERAQETLVTNLREAADALQAAGLRLMVEAINTFDVPGFLVHGTGQALDLIAATGREGIELQYDVYHMQRMEGELAATLERHLPRIGHIQVADNPGRHEPGTGEIRFDFLFELLDRLGYAGWVGCEYHPRTTTVEGLGWLAPWRGSGVRQNRTECGMTASPPPRPAPAATP